MFCFSLYFFTFEYRKRKEKYTLNSIVLQNLLEHLFNHSRVGIKEKKCFVKKIDNNVLCCTLSASMTII